MTSSCIGPQDVPAASVTSTGGRAIREGRDCSRKSLEALPNVLSGIVAAVHFTAHELCPEKTTYPESRKVAQKSRFGSRAAFGRMTA